MLSSTMQWFRHTFFPTPLYVGTLTGGSTDAGLPNRTDEKVTMATSEWTNLVTNLDTGNHLVTVDLLNIPSASGLPMNLQLVHNSMNASVDIGVGKGWMTNLHTCVSEDQQTGDITYLDPSGAQYIFEYDSGSQTYTNPKGFAGQLTKEANGTYSLQTLGHTKYTFNTDGKLSSISETCGTTTDSINIGYNANGDPITITDSLSNRSITLTWDGSDNLTQVSDPMSHSWNLTQNASDQLTEVQQPQDNSQSPPPTPPSCGFTYTNDRITGHTDFLGDSYTIAYAASSPYKVTSWTDPASKQTSFAYTTASTPYDHKSTVTDAESIATDYYFGATSGELEKIEQVSGATTLKIEMGYNTTTGFQTTSKDSYGNTTTIAYDSVGHVTQITPPAGAAGQYTQSFTYSIPTSIDSVLEQSQETVTLQDNATTSYLYTDPDNPCLPTSIIDPLSQTTTLEYNDHGQITSVTQPTTGGTKETTFGYHPTTHDLNKLTDSINNDTVLVRDLNGNIITAKRYEGDVATGTLKDETDYILNQNNTLTVQTSDTTGQSSSVTVNRNGAVDTSTSALGCISSKDFYDASSIPMPTKFSLRAPSKDNGSIQLPWIPAPRFPMDPYHPLPASSTNSKNQTSFYAYKNNGSLYTRTNYVGQVTGTYAYDSFGRRSTVTNAYGKTTTYTLDLNNRPTSIVREGQGTVSYTYDNLGLTTAITDPVKGTLSFSYNLRGDAMTNPDGTYTRDLLGRATAFAYTAGGPSDSIGYTPDGYVSSFNSLSYVRNNIGQLTTWNNSMNGNGAASFNYTGTGSTALGLVGSMTGTSNVGSQSYQYDSKHWLSSFTDTSKTPNLSFGYTYSNAKELTFLNYPANIQLQQIWTAKNVTSQSYTNTQTLTNYATVSQSYTNDKLTGYSYNIKAGMTNFSDTVTPSYVSTGPMKEKLDTLTYSGSGRVITYGYNANHGRLNSLKYSDINPTTPFSLNYDAAGRLSTIVDPNSSTVVSYTYNQNNQGLLSTITYAGNKSATFTWNAKKQITNYVYTDNSQQPPATKAYEMTYYDDGRLASHSYTQNDVYLYEWKYFYSPYGLDKLQKYNSGQLLINIDTTVSPKGKVLSLNYTDYTCQANCFQGEALALYDPCDNLVSLISKATSAEVWARATDKNTNGTIYIHDPFNIEMPISAKGTINPSYDQPINGPIEFHIPEQGMWDLKESIANQTKINTVLGEYGVSASMHGDDDCGEQICGDPDWSKYVRCMQRCFGDCIRAVNTDYDSLTDCIQIDSKWEDKREERLEFKWSEWTRINGAVDATFDAVLASLGLADLAAAISWYFDKGPYGVAILGLDILGAFIAYFVQRPQWKNDLTSAGLNCGEYFEHSMGMNVRYERRCREYCKRYQPAEWRAIPNN